MAEYEYYIFFVSNDTRLATVENLAGQVREYWDLDEGVRMGDRFPPTAEMEIHEDSGDMITDFLNNISRAVMISEKVRSIFEDEGLGPDVVEYLPFVLKDKRGRIVKKKYSVANALVKISCMDRDASKYADDPKDGEIIKIRVLNVLKEKIPDDAKYFRLGEYPSRTIIRSDLLERLKSEGVTGISVRSMGEKLR